MLSLMLASGAAFAQSTDIGAVNVNGAGNGLPPISASDAVGSKAPAGTAPALAPSQGSLASFQPGSIVSDKVIRDMIPASSDYNETAKYTPGFLSNNPNGLIGDSKGGWRGFVDGQFNITFDGIPFGDANDPTHHSAAYFPGAFIGGVTIDRGPGGASQVGYATFGGTMALKSFDLSDTFGGHVDASFGTFGTFAGSTTVQTGLIGDTGLRGLFQYYNAQTDGALSYGHYDQSQFLGKVDKTFNNGFKITVFGNYGLENYNNVAAPTYAQFKQFGKSYGEINNNPLTQQYVGFNNSTKQTDMEYIDVDGTIPGDIHIDNKIYTYSYFYPTLQNNGADQTVEGAGIGATTAGLTQGTKAFSNNFYAAVPNYNAQGQLITTAVDPFTGKKNTTNKYVLVNGVTAGDVIGFVKNNDYRAYGDIFKGDRYFDAGIASGTLRAGVWVEHVENTRLQENRDYTTGQNFPEMGDSLQASFKLDLASRITNYQPFIEYDWQPIDGLTITPGYKYVSFTRDHEALVNQTTLQTLNVSETYDSSLPYLAAHYKVTPEITVYAQASKGTLAPTVSAFYIFNPSQGGIKAQSTTNYQAGAVFKNERFTADADAYQITATNFPLINTTSTGLQTYTNAGTARYQGLEAEGSYSIVNGLSVYGSGALIGARYISSGQGLTDMRVGDAPDYTIAAGAIYDDGHFFASAVQKFTGGYYGSGGETSQVAGSNQRVNYVKAYNTLDLVGGVRVNTAETMGYGKTMTFKFGIYNAFDHRNITEIAGNAAKVTNANFTTQNTLTYSFLPGRILFGQVGFDF